MVAVLCAIPALATPDTGMIESSVEAARKSGADFATVEIFTDAIDLGAVRTPGNWARFADASDVLSAATLTTVRPRALAGLKADAPETLGLSLPYNGSRTGLLELELVRVNFFTDDFQVLTSVPEGEPHYDLGVHYRGIIRGERGSVAAVSIFDDQVMGMVASQSMGEVVIGRFEGGEADGAHVLYASGDLVGVDAPSCFTGDDKGDGSKLGRSSILDALDIDPGVHSSARDAGDCVNLYFETDYNIYQDKGSTSAVTSFVTGIFNQVSTIYANESIETGLSQIFVWNSNDPYTATSAGSLLNQFQSNRPSFNGDLGQVLKLGNVSGIAAGFSGLCAGNRANSQSASFITSSYSTVPTFSLTVFVVAHEFGHLFGSRHTHACVWNGNNTAIDGCSGFTEGSCPIPGLPAGGGTIMSYCPGTAVGVNFNNGFGPQPGNVIRSRVASASCLSATCDGGGGSCHIGSNGGYDYCKVGCKCDAGEGDCDSDAECNAGLVCAQDVGANYGFPANVDVCEVPSTNPNSCVGNCGGQAPGGCYCDSACSFYGDCCADKVAVCG